MPNRASAFIIAALLALPLLAGCGSSSGSNSRSSYGSSDTSTATAGGGAGSRTEGGSGPETIATTSGDLGTILVDGEGKTLYLFEQDSGPQSTCSGECLQHWPAVTTDGKPLAGEGVTASMLGTSKRSDGALQVTYAGHPLYYFAGDSGPGETSGQGVDAFGAEWYVLGPDGDKVEGHEAGDDSDDSSSAGGSY